MTLVQVKSNQNAGGTSSSVGSGQGWASSTAGNLIVVVVAIQLGSAPSVTDNLGSTYTQDYSFQTGRIAVFSLANNPGGITSITASSAFDTQKIAVFEYSGAATTSPFDTSAVGLDNGFAVSNWTTNTTGTTNANGGIVLTIAYDWRTNGSALTISTAGYTSEVAAASGGGTWAIWDKADSGSTTYSASGSSTGGGQIVTGIVVYKASGAAPPSGKLFASASLNGLGSGGPFFGNPIGMN
jgi:hypothetical protein